MVGAAIPAAGPHVIGWVLLAELFIPVGDLLISLRHKGKRAVPFGVHGPRAAVMVVTTLLLVLG